MSQQGPSFPFLLEMTDLTDIDFEGFLRRNQLFPKQIRIITGFRYSKQIANVLARRVRSLPVEVVPAATNSLTFHRRISQGTPRLPGETLMIGVGGGGVLDLAKYHASQLQQPYLAVPTVVSNDGIASPIAILEGDRGDMQSYSTVPPIGILIDRAILQGAPAWAFTNGLGDVLSNHSAVMDWDLAVRHGRAEPNALARMMSRTAVQSVVDCAPDLHDPSFLERYINAVVLSGLAMYISGNSRPCSGAEHLIAHAITRAHPARFGHGFLVGSIAPFIVWLHQRTDRSLLPLAKAVGFEFDFVKLLGRGQSFASLIDEARTIRGPRFTVLDQLSNRELAAEYRGYLRSVGTRIGTPVFPAVGAAVQ